MAHNSAAAQPVVHRPRSTHMKPNSLLPRRHRLHPWSTFHIRTEGDPHPWAVPDVPAKIRIGVPGNNRVMPRKPPAPPPSHHFQLKVHTPEHAAQPPLLSAPLQPCGQLAVAGCFTTDVLDPGSGERRRG